MYSVFRSAIIGLLLSTGSSLAITLDSSNTTSVTSAAKTIADRIMSMYNGTEPGEAPGLFPQSYYWWEAGLAWDTLVNYWAQVGDDTYNDIVNEALSWQVGPDNNYLPPNQTRSIGNDDQSFWALAAMTAAEQGFPAPAIEGYNLTWAQLAENVFDSQVARWDEDTCGGGLRWQIFTFNNGYNYKNALSNGNLYQLASRLALYTGNSTYSDWAERILAWSVQTGLVSNATGAVFDGFDTTTNCSTPNRIQWTANIGTYLSGAAHLQNHSATLTHSGPPFAFFNNLNNSFTQDHVLYETACELDSLCNTDQLAFKAVASRALARARDLDLGSAALTVDGAPAGTFQGAIDSVIQASAQGAAAQCSGGDSGSICGTTWLNSTWDGSQGLGQDLAALEIILATLPGKGLRNANSSTPVTGSDSTGSNSTGSNPTTSSPGPSSTPLPSSNGANNMSSSLLSLILAVSFTMVGFAM